MVTHFNLQSMDHKLALKEQELKLSDVELIKSALKHYYTTLENSLEKICEAGLDDISKEITSKLEEVRQLRRKIDGE